MQAAGLAARGIKQNSADGQGSSLRRRRSARNVAGAALGICVKCEAGRRFSFHRQTARCDVIRGKKSTNADGVDGN